MILDTTDKNHEDYLYSKRIIFALRHLMQHMDVHSRNLMKKYDITVAQILCLYELYEKGTMTLSVLAKNIHLSSSTLVGIIDRLEEKKHVIRTRDKKDRRIIFINVTETGKEFIENSQDLLHNRLHKTITELTAEEKIIISNSLDLLLKMFE